MPSLYENLRTRGQLLEVDMDDVQILEPDDDQIAIGTKDLNGCSTIVIISEGIIMAHIAPADGTDQASNGSEHFVKKAREALALMIEHKELFDNSTTTWGIFARIGGEVPLEHFARWLGQAFEHLKIPTRQAFYNVDPRYTEPRQLPTGSVFVLREGRRLFLEDKEQTPGQQRLQSGVQRTLSRAGSVAGPSTRSIQAIDNTPSSSRQAANTANRPSGNVSTDQADSGWRCRDGSYIRIQGRNVLERRSTAPERQQFFHEATGSWMWWDGTNFWQSKKGVWTKV